VKNRPTGDRLEFTTAMSATNGPFVDKNSYLILSYLKSIAKLVLDPAVTFLEN